MLFHTLDYFFFLPLVVFLYWGLPRSWRASVLALASLGFYASWSLAYLPIMLMVILVAWGGGLWLYSWRRYRGGMLRRTVVLLLLLLPLFFFKYWDWVAENVEWIAGLTGATPGLPKVDLPLPVGISFFSFQAMAYVIDVARMRGDGPDRPESNVVRFATFQSFFPQLVAGPIVRRHELMPQIVNMPLLRRTDVGEGVFRILRGLVKKVLIADVVRVGMVDPVFSDPSRFTGVEMMCALYAYTLQIYCDFSGYTDIAVGSALLFGIRLPENFNLPYRATSVAGFWRRWHITLSNWVRDYIYYPLGGSKQQGGGPARVYANIILTLLIIGVWHGASWNFVVYGILHGSAVALNRWQRKRTGRRPGDPLPSAWSWAWRWAATFHFVVFARILFRSEDLTSAASIFTGIFDGALLMPRFSPTVWAVFAIGYAAHFLPRRWALDAEDWFVERNTMVWVLVAALVGSATMLMGTGEHLAFVYYQF